MRTFTSATWRFCVGSIRPSMPDLWPSTQTASDVEASSPGPAAVGITAMTPAGIGVGDGSDGGADGVAAIASVAGGLVGVGDDEAVEGPVPTGPTHPATNSRATTALAARLISMLPRSWAAGSWDRKWTL